MTECARCTHLARLLTDQESALAELGQQLAGLQIQLRRAGQAEVMAKNELKKAREEGPEADDVREIMHLWRSEVKAGNKRHVLRVTDPRGLRTHWAIRRYGKARCHDAIMGCTLDGWAMGRNAKTEGRTANDLAKHIFKDNETIERFEGLWLSRDAAEIAAECFQAEKPAPARGEPVPPTIVKPQGALPTEEAIASYEARLRGHPKLLERLFMRRGWTLESLTALNVGWDGSRVTFPIRDAGGRLVNVARYLPGGKPKMVSVAGRPRDLFPAPETVKGDTVWLVEGEPDALSAREFGLPGVAVPGVSKWDDAWTSRLASRRVVICTDCDDPGRQAAQRIAGHLAGHAVEVRVIDLDPGRSDGHDLTDFLVAGGGVRALNELAASASVIHSIGRQEAA